MAGPVECGHVVPLVAAAGDIGRVPAVAGDGVPGRLPVEDADRAGAAGGVLHGGEVRGLARPGQRVARAAGAGRVRGAVGVGRGERVGGLGEDDILAVAGLHVRNDAGQVRQRAVPEAVVRQAGDVPADTLRLDPVVEPAGVRVAVGVRGMDDDLRAAVARLCRVVAGLEQQAEVGEVVVDHFAVVPQHADVDLVADLHT